MTRTKKAAAAMLNTWKFQKGDTVMIARGRNSGRVATITGIVRDGNTVPRRGRHVARHKKEKWKENPKVFLDGKANAGRRILRGNRSVDTDRPLPMSNLCHVVQRTTATNKSSYKCVRVEFTEQEGTNKKVRVPKANPAQQLAPRWKKKSRLPKDTKLRSAKFVSADVAHQRTYFPPTSHSRSTFSQTHAVSSPRAMYHAKAAHHFSSFASQLQHSRYSTSSHSWSASSLPLLERGHAGAVWEQLQNLLQNSHGSGGD